MNLSKLQSEAVKKPTPPNCMDIGNTLTLRFIGEAIVYLADVINLSIQSKEK